MLRSWRVWAGFGITLLFLGLFLYNTDFRDIGNSFKNANYLLALASLPVYFVGIWVRTLRWQYLLRPVKKLSVWRLYPVVIIGLMANNVIPARAGELVRAFVLGERENVSKASSLGTIAVDRLFDGLTLVPLMLIIIPIAGNTEKFPLPVVDFTINLAQLAFIMAVLFGAALAVLFVLAFSGRSRDWVDAMILRLTPARFHDSIEGLAQSFFVGLNALRNPVDLTLAWLMSTVSWLIEGTMYYIVARAFGVDVGFEYILLITAAANLAISVLASQGGIGPFELVAKQTLIAASVAQASAEAYAIALHALVLLPVTAIGLYLMGTMGLSLGEMFKRSTTSSRGAGDAPFAVRPEEVPGS